MWKYARTFCVPLLLILLTSCASIAARQETKATDYQEALLSPGAGTVEPTSPSSGGAGEQGNENAKGTRISILRYVGADDRAWPDNKSGIALSDLYTRIELRINGNSSGNTSQPASGGGNDLRAVRSYEKEDRSWVERLFFSETDTVTALANVEIKNPDMKIAVPLYSVTHASGRGLGNSWVTNFTASYVESPLFRMTANSALVVHLNAQVSQDLKSQATSMVVGAVTQAVQIAAPTSTLLTALSKPEVNSAAQAIDSTISTLISQDKTEDLRLGRFADTWTPSTQFALSGCAPFVRLDGSPSRDDRCDRFAAADSSEYDDLRVGEWTIMLRCPQLSAFDEQDICHDPDGHALKTDKTLSSQEQRAAFAKILSRINYAQVLQFPLSSQVNIRAFVLSRDWYTTFLKSKQDPDAVTDFCANAVSGPSGFYANGLSWFDSAVALGATIRELSGLVKYRDRFRVNSGCKQVLDGSQVTL